MKTALRGTTTRIQSVHSHGGESRDTTTKRMTDIWRNSPLSGKKIFNNSVKTWPIGIWFEAEKAEGLRGFAWCVRFFKQHLIKKLLTSKQIIQGKKFVCSSITFFIGCCLKNLTHQANPWSPSAFSASNQIPIGHVLTELLKIFLPQVGEFFQMSGHFCCCGVTWFPAVIVKALVSIKNTHEKSGYRSGSDPEQTDWQLPPKL